MIYHMITACCERKLNRAQAALCLEIASEKSDPKAAEKLRGDAADYYQRAVKLETREEAL